MFFGFDVVVLIFPIKVFALKLMFEIRRTKKSKTGHRKNIESANPWIFEITGHIYDSILAQDRDVWSAWEGGFVQRAMIKQEGRQPDVDSGDDGARL